MKPALVILAIAAALIFFMLIIPIFANAQEITLVETQGTCREFTIIVTGKELGESCWDVKLDIPGEVLDARSGEWKSGFFYVEKAICHPDAAATMSAKLDTSEPVIEAKAKLRQGSRVVEKDFTIRQSCQQPMSDSWVLLVSVVIILIFGWGLAWWWKGAKK